MKKLFLIFALSHLSTFSFSRSVYVNGKDVSSVKGQFMKNVSIRIDDHGDIYIDAPQYQIIEEDSYVPLSSMTQKQKKQVLPEHRAEPIPIAKNDEKKIISEPSPAAPIPVPSATLSSPLPVPSQNP